MRAATRLCGLATVLGCLFAASLSGCGGGGGGGGGQGQPSPTPAPPTPTPAPVPPVGTVTNPSGSGLADLGVGDPQNILYAFPGQQSERELVLQKSGQSEFDVTVTLGADVLRVAERDGVHSLVLDTTTLAAGAARAFTITVRNRANGVTAEIHGPLRVMTPAVIASGRITSAGGSIQSNDGTILLDFEASNGAPDVGVTVEAFAIPSGDRRLRIQFDRDVVNDTRGMRIVRQDRQLGSLSSTRPASGHARAQSDPYPGFVPWRPVTADFTEYREFRVRDEHIPIAQWIYSCSVAVVALRTACFRERTASVLTGKFPPEAMLDVTGEPVLFVHGYTVALSGADLGGGYGTWRDLPQRVAQLPLGAAPTARYIPFEFQWATNARFQDVADDLARAIQEINEKTHKEVTIVAHSFGGVLVRTMLQRHGLSDLVTGGSIASKVKQVVTLGTPHSGIAFVNQQHASATDGNVTLPAGLDPKSLSGAAVFVCGQITCYEMGATTIFTLTLGLQGLLGLDPDRGAHAARLWRTRGNNPRPLAIGIGLSLEPEGDRRLRHGDGLITFAGQRFEPDTTDASESRPLLNCTASVREHMLGGDTRRPEQILSSGDGYAHNSRAAGERDQFEAAVTMGVFDPTTDPCTQGSGCHPTFKLIKDVLTSGVCPVPDIAPSISTHPTSITVRAGQSAAFNVVATGTPTLTYEWYRSEPGSLAQICTNSPTCTFGPVSAADNGIRVHVVVRNNVSLVVSQQATLTVDTSTPPPPPDPLLSKGRIALCNFCSLVATQNGVLSVAGNQAAGASALGVPPFTPGPWVDATNLAQVSQIASRTDGSLAVRTDGSLWVTGNGAFGKLGNGGASVNLWSSIGSLAGVRTVAKAGAASYAVTTGDQLWVAGTNLYGQVGLDPPTGQVFHLQWAHVPYVSDVKTIAAFESHALLLTHGRRVLGAGKNSTGSDGRLGFGDMQDVVRWTEIPELVDIVDIAVGFNHSLALTAGGRIWATGDVSGSTSSFGWMPRRTFGEVPGISDVKAVAAGSFCSMAIRGDDRTLWVAGSNAARAFGTGLGSPTYLAVWTPVLNMSDVKAIATDCNKSIAIKNNGTLWVAGQNEFGALGFGNPNTASGPATIPIWTEVTGRVGY